ncbi:unnamed protein product [Ixodes persulcatus]
MASGGKGFSWGLVRMEEKRGRVASSVVAAALVRFCSGASDRGAQRSSASPLCVQTEGGLGGGRCLPGRSTRRRHVVIDEGQMCETAVLATSQRPFVPLPAVLTRETRGSERHLRTGPRSMRRV